MKERIQFHIDKFIDESGKERYFILCGLSQETSFDSFYYCFGSFPMIERVDFNICKGLKLGYAICNPDDKFNEELGKTIAEGRARKNKDYALLATKPGYINTDTVDALLKREAEFLKKNPEKYIKGYERMVRRTLA